MNADLERLIALQKLDSTGDAARKKLAAEPEHEALLEARLAAARPQGGAGEGRGGGRAPAGGGGEGAGGGQQERPRGPRKGRRGPAGTAVEVPRDGDGGED